MRILPLLLCVAAVLPLAAQSHETVNVTAIEVIAEVRDKSGAVPKDLKASDFTVLENGVEIPVIGIESLALPRTAPGGAATPAAPAPEAEASSPWHFLFYFESELSGMQGRKLVAEAIARQAESLVARGTVDVVLANPSPVALLRNSRSPEAIRDALAKVASHKGINQLAVSRRRFQQSLLGRGESVDWNEIRPFVYEDIARANTFRQNLGRWLSSYSRHAPRMAVIVTDGFDLDPIEYYVTAVDPGNAKEISRVAQLRSEASGLQLATRTEEFAKELAGGSWIISSVPTQMDMGMAVDDAATWGLGRVSSEKQKIGAKALVNIPTAPLIMMAEATGGTVIGNHSQFGEALDTLDRYVKLTYQVSRPPDGEIRKVEVRTRRPGLTVRAQEWVSGMTPQEIASARTLALLEGAEYPGELPVRMTVTRPGFVEGVADLSSLALLIEERKWRRFRITIASLQGAGAKVVSKLAPSVNVSGGRFTFRLPIDLPPNVSAVAVSVEDLLTGAWGSAKVNASEIRPE